MLLCRIIVVIIIRHRQAAVITQSVFVVAYFSVDVAPLFLLATIVVGVPSAANIVISVHSSDQRRKKSAVC